MDPIDPWPHSEAGRFHRVISLMLVVLAVLVAVVALARNHGLADSASLGALKVVSGLVARLLLRDLRKHPANFPKPAPSHGPRIAENPERRQWFSPMANDPH